MPKNLRTRGLKKIQHNEKKTDWNILISEKNATPNDNIPIVLMLYVVTLGILQVYLICIYYIIQ